jgi:hypothetical protein
MLYGADRALAAGMQCDGCFALVDASGNVGRSRGVVSTAKLEEGRYEVTFTEPVTKCAFTAPIGVTVSTSPDVARPAMVAATGDDASEASTGVIVQTFGCSVNPSGVAAAACGLDHVLRPCARQRGPVPPRVRARAR